MRKWGKLLKIKTGGGLPPRSLRHQCLSLCGSPVATSEVLMYASPPLMVMPTQILVLLSRSISVGSWAVLAGSWAVLVAI